MTAAAVLIGLCGLVSAGAAQAPASEDRAWATLRTALTSEHDEQRRSAARVLGLLEGDETARGLALEALKDKDADVRAAAADALGQMHAKGVAPELIALVKKESEVVVVMAGARALISLGDPTGYAVYYAVLTGERKAGGGLLESQKKM